MSISPFNKALKQTARWIGEQPGLEKEHGFYAIHSALIKSSGDRVLAEQHLAQRKIQISTVVPFPKNNSGERP